MKKEFIVAGVLLVMVGTLIFAVSQISRTGEVEALQIAFSKNVYTQGWGISMVEAPLESYKEYKFNVTCAGVSTPDINVTDPDGFSVSYAFDSWAKDEGYNLTNYWGYEPTYGHFLSNKAGNYIFSITGFAGNPEITLSVFKVGSREQTFYSFENFIFVAIGLWAIGVALSFIGVFWRKKS